MRTELRANRFAGKAPTKKTFYPRATPHKAQRYIHKMLLQNEFLEETHDIHHIFHTPATRDIHSRLQMSPFVESPISHKMYNNFEMVRNAKAHSGDSLMQSSADDNTLRYTQLANVSAEPFVSEKPAMETEPEVSPFDVLTAMLDQVAGKDKLAKTLQYGLRILVLYSTSITTSLSQQMNFKPELYRGSKQSLIMNFIKNPAKFFKVLVVLLTHHFNRRSVGVLDAISIFRQCMRFGKSPLRVQKILQTTVLSPAACKSPQSFQRAVLNEGMLSQVLDLYYGLMDESILLAKMGVLTNESYKQFANRHSALAWYYNIMFGLQKSIASLATLRQQEFQLKIQQQVKVKATQLSKQLMESISMEVSSPMRSRLNFLVNDGSESATDYTKEIANVKLQQKLVYVDMCRLACDFTFDSIDVFHLKAPATLYLLSGFGSGLFGSYKVWKTTRSDMVTRIKARSQA
ncbi:hypothetical protein BABINDRAFT_163175 [Babjeviella inositovora NRRL Y-12698]|uniref:Peroxisomal membrane protein PEX25 n=1 Tax=Babjeviella inositovora NRRL Y-12698 TaxID=984486 RepID=A0A1E3QL22_9ASCO|nr:uncharacterized protein BABINDRAFT_163175 [Babjeviella inositovora NRRL Y-12698]ODQ77782.1 hypothetical protein BABINDRAFT_163175 [Babjeviella inositovora NRRL Y-12698]